MVVTLAGQFVLAIELEGNGYMYLYFLCFLVCFEMGITEWASLVRVCERGGNSQVYRNPTGLTVPLWLFCHGREDEEEGIGDEDDRNGVGSSGEESSIVPQYISDPRQHQQYWLQRFVG